MVDYFVLAPYGRHGANAIHKISHGNSVSKNHGQKIVYLDLGII